jgi:adenylylsulfate kinase-like enzyme
VQAIIKQRAIQIFTPVRELLTMHQIMKALDKPQQDRGKRAPVILFLGGGMAAGKSTVRELIGKDQFWSALGPEAVVIEADAIKNQVCLTMEVYMSAAQIICKESCCTITAKLAFEESV